MEQRGSSRAIAGLTRAFRLRSVAVFMLGYAGNRAVRIQRSKRKRRSAVGCAASLRSGFLTIILMKGFK